METKSTTTNPTRLEAKMNMDAWITGNQGHDHPDNDLCPECREDADHHCPECGACGAEVSEECETCIDDLEYEKMRTA